MELISKYKIQGENTPVTTSRKVAEVFDKEHKNIIRDVEKIIDDMKSRGLDLSHQMFVVDSYKSRGKDYKQYLLSQDGFTLLAMGFTGSKALGFKVAYIKAFNEMKKELEEFRYKRKIAVESYKRVTKALKEKLGDNARPYHFSNEANMIQKIVLGMSAKKYCEVHNIEKKNLREHLSLKELELISKIEEYDEVLIREGLSFDIRKKECTSLFQRICNTSKNLLKD